MPKYRIRDWDKHFENAASRKLTRLSWVAIPNKMDGEGYTALVEHRNGAAHLGAWYAIVEIASKQEPRGNLPGGITHDLGGICRSLGRISRLPPEVFREVIPRLLEIGWLEDFDCQNSQVHHNQQNVQEKVADSADVVADDGRLAAAHRIEQNGIEEKHTHTARAPIAADLNGQTSQRFPEFWQRWPRKQHRDAACRLWISVVSVEDEAAVFGCLDRFLASEQAARAIIPNPENWLLEQSRDRWQGDWPARASPATERKSRQQENADAWREA